MYGYRIPIVTAVLLLSAQGLIAQESAPIAAGTRVRYTALGSAGQPALGTVIRVERDTLFLAPTKFGQPFSAVPLEAVSQLEVARVTGTKVTPGAMFGAMGGALLGGALGALADLASDATELECTGGWFTALKCTEKPVDTSGQSILNGVLLGGLAGGIIGGLIGSSMETVQWEPVSLEDMALAISADRRPGITIAARIGGAVARRP